jgi:hypothetical protein
VADVTKFPDLASQVYLESREAGSSDMLVLELTQWILGIYNIGIMNLLDVPHFGRENPINAYVKKFLACIYGGILWMDRSMPITVDLIVGITGIPTDGEMSKTWRTKQEPRTSHMRSRISMV